MCYYVSNSLTRKEMKDTFGVDYKGQDYQGSEFTNGFTHPQSPVILDDQPEEALLATWGLIPPWAKDRSIQNATLNARIETLDTKPSFKEVVNNRCLVLVKGFYEWKWLDSKGKNKDKYFIRLNNGDQPFALGGIYNTWTDPETNDLLTTFSIVTSKANELMTEIHHTKDRMPLVLTKAAAAAWLREQPVPQFDFPLYNPDLLAVNLDNSLGQLSLF